MYNANVTPVIITNRKQTDLFNKCYTDCGKAEVKCAATVNTFFTQTSVKSVLLR